MKDSCFGGKSSSELDPLCKCLYPPVCYCRYDICRLDGDFVCHKAAGSCDSAITFANNHESSPTCVCPTK